MPIHDESSFEVLESLGNDGAFLINPILTNPFYSKFFIMLD